MNLGETIKDLRLKAGLSQGELARKSGITSSAVSQIESGNINPKVSVLDSIADILMPGAKGVILIALSVTEEDVPEDRREMFNTTMPSYVDLVKNLWGLK